MGQLELALDGNTEKLTVLVDLPERRFESIYRVLIAALVQGWRGV